MINYDFWKQWTNRNELEERAITSVQKARELVIDSVPPKALVAIYIKGSFTRREMNEGSDVDLVPIVSENKYEGDIFGVNCPEIDPVVVVPLSLEELRANKLSSKRNYTPDLRAEPDLFLLKLDHYRLIYGKPLRPQDFPLRSKEQIVHDEINKIRNGYIAAYREGTIDFQPLLKEVFWLVAWQQEAQGHLVDHSFKGITSGITDRTHIIYDALQLRENSPITKAKEREFVSKLEKYLGRLDHNV